MMVGPSDVDSTNMEDSVKWKIKRDTNDELSQKFVDAIVPQAEKIGLVIPDKDLNWDKKRNESSKKLKISEHISKSLKKSKMTENL